MNMRPCHVSSFFPLPWFFRAKAKPVERVLESERRGGDSVHDSVQCSDGVSSYMTTRCPGAFACLPRSCTLPSCSCWSRSRVTHAFSRGQSFKMGKAASGSDGYWPYWTPYKTWDFPSKYYASAWPGLTAGLCARTSLRRPGSGVVEGGCSFGRASYIFK